MMRADHYPDRIEFYDDTGQLASTYDPKTDTFKHETNGIERLIRGIWKHQINALRGIANG